MRKKDLNGLVRAFYNSGKLMNKHTLLNGRRHGVEEMYRENGELVYREYYIHGEKVTEEEYNKMIN